MYKGQTVAVIPVDKPEINLTSQDLVELVNVCSVFICYFQVSAAILYTLYTQNISQVFYGMQHDIFCFKYGTLNVFEAVIRT